MTNNISLRVFGYDANDLSGTLEQFKRYGVTSVTGGADDNAARFFTEHGIDYYVVQGCFSVDKNTDSPENYCTDISGVKTKWFGSGCPNNPAVKERFLSEAGRLASLPHITGVAADGLRFASPANAEGEDAFFTCFCEHCQKEMDALGYPYGEIHTCVSALYAHCKTGESFDKKVHAGGVRMWLDFRKRIITRHLNEFVAVVKNASSVLKAGIYCFTPSLSALVGQDYAELANIFDFISPMIYRHYKEVIGTACLDHEIAALLKYTDHLPDNKKQPVLELFEELTGLPFTDAPPITELIENGCPPGYVETEINKARAALGNAAEIAPIFLIDDICLPAYAETCTAHNINTADFFMYKPEHLGRAYRVFCQ